MIGHTNYGEGATAFARHDSTATAHLTTLAKGYASPSLRIYFLLQTPRPPTATPITPQPVGDSVHLPDELVDVLFPVTMITTLNVMFEFTCSPATSGVRQLEGPQEVGSLESRVRPHAEGRRERTRLPA